MKVKELIAILEEMDADAEVLIMSQQNWPFEYATYGVTVRSEMEGGDEEDEDGEPAPRVNGCQSNDVFIVEGAQLRYGSKDAWNTAVRA
jgi:hypothetical protein